MSNIKTFFTNVEDGDVKQNKNLIDKYEVCIQNLKYMSQIHSSNVESITKHSNQCILNCDGLITKEKNTPLLVMVADCIPVLIHDIKGVAIGAIHAGRVGTFKKIAQKAIFKMSLEFNINIQDIKAILGPSIQKCCYSVSDEMICFVKDNFGIEYINGKNIDLQGINKKQLLDIGVLEQNINISSICTKCDDRYFSYRRDNTPKRFAGVIINNK